MMLLFKDENEIVRKLLLFHPLDLIMYYHAVRSWRFKRLIKKVIKLKIRGYAQ